MDSFFLFAQTGVEKEALTLALRVPLSLMNFLEFAVWGAWFVVLGNYLNALQFSRKDIGRIYATMALGSVISPIFVGAIADRYFRSELLMGVLHLVGAGLLFAMSQIRTPRAFYWTTLAYAIVYGPTLSLVNSITFTNVPDVARDAASVRTFGTIGWIVAGLSLRFLVPAGERMTNRPLILAAVLSLILGVISLVALPSTPPTGTGEIAFFGAFALFNSFSFAVFFGVSFFLTLALAFYYSWTALFLESHGKVKPENVGPLMTIGQWMEIIFLLLLPWFISTLGMKWVLIVGMIAWAVRYAIFASLPGLPLLFVGLALHGICYDFFFFAGFMYVDQAAPVEFRASGQALFGVLTYGLGMWLGTEASGWLNQWATTETLDPATGQTVRHTDWRKFWLIPCVGVVVCLIAFVILS